MPRRRRYRRSDSEDLYEALKIIEDELFRMERLESYGRTMYRDAPRKSRSTRAPRRKSTKPRKLSSWQKYIKNKKNHIKLRSGKLNLKKMAVQFRKTKAGKRKK